MALWFLLARYAADPALGAQAPANTGTLALVAGSLGVAALASLTGVVGARRTARSAARLARSQSDGLHELLSSIRAGQDAEGAGVWQYDPMTGEQHWSHAMRRLFGVDHADAFVPGDAETLLCAHGIDLVPQVTQLSDLRKPYTLEYALCIDAPAAAADADAAADPPRRVRVEACNLFDADGARVRVVALVREITDCTD